MFTPRMFPNLLLRKFEADVCRIPEMSMGWGSDLQRNETTFLILDGGMILTSVLMLTIFHPFLFFPYMGKHHQPVEEHSSTQAADTPEVVSERKD